MKRRDAWRAILSTRTDVDRMVASAVGDYPDRTPVRPASTVPFGEATWQDPGASSSRTGDTQVVQLSGVNGSASGSAAGTKASASRSIAVTDDERRTLAVLHDRVKARVAKLEQQLASEGGRHEAMTALVLYLDERIMDRLPDYLQMSWPLLQQGRTGSATGGDDFYRFVDMLITDAATPSFVFEVYYFCLSDGFVGRYANDLERIEEYEQSLRNVIEQPRIASEVNDTAEVSTERSNPIPGWAAYAGSLGVVVLITAVVTLLSNY